MPSLCACAQSRLTLCNLMVCAHQAPVSMGILQARILLWIAMPSSRGSSNPGIRPHCGQILHHLCQQES